MRGPRACVEPRHDGHVLAEVAVEQDHPRDVGAALKLFAQQRRGAIAAAVVDEYDLVTDPQCVQGRIQAGEERRQAFLFVVDGNDDRGCGSGHASILAHGLA